MLVATALRRRSARLTERRVPSAVAGNARPKCFPVRAQRRTTGPSRLAARFLRRPYAPDPHVSAPCKNDLKVPVIMSQDVELDHVRMTFGTFTAVRDINLTIKAGEFFS